ncbi:unnamed protein product [Blepharisma stoltei]|uniref:PH domain-containing protein n=1 Tax=Blepharisma stoltei TaxID=1481888 RepID=A0AAU9JBP9_9CILI|nr:unnamed protein product [Blepharisma stoltei]
MEELLNNNQYCADCDSEKIEGVNMQFGVLVCKACAKTHSQFNMPIRRLHEPFLGEEITFLLSRGNKKVNDSLLINLDPWIATPKIFKFESVRYWYIESKYIQMIFARERREKKRPTYDLNKYWFYIDEVSKRFPITRGPVTRWEIRKMVNDAEVLFLESYIWHPILGHKWCHVEKTLDAINPSSEQDDIVTQEKYQKMLILLDKRYPHLKGTVEVVVGKSKPQKKWLVLYMKKLLIFPSSNSSHFDLELHLDSTSLDLVDSGNSVMISVISEGIKLLISANIWEVMEWYHSLSLAVYLIRNLEDDLVIKEPDLSEMHVCNVTTSRDYMGDKVMEGQLKKEGAIFKSLNPKWFILRTQGLYWYASKNDKALREKDAIRLFYDSSVEEESDAKNGFGFILISRVTKITLWAENEEQRSKWVYYLKETIEHLKTLHEGVCLLSMT